MGSIKHASPSAIEPDLGSMDLFPSETDEAGFRARSCPAVRTVSQLADFPTERRPERPIPGRSAPANQEPGQPIAVGANGELNRTVNARDTAARPTLPPHQDLLSGAAADRRTGSRRSAWAVRAVAAVLVPACLGGVLLLHRPKPTRADAEDRPLTDVAPAAGVTAEAAKTPSTMTPATDAAAPIAVTPAVDPAANMPASRPSLSATLPVDSTAEPVRKAVENAPAAARGSATPAAVGNSAPPDTVRFLGTLSVESPIAGAQVYVDGKFAGVTPIADWQVAAGSHVVRVEADGYVRWSAVVQVVTGRKTALQADLEQVQR